MGAGEGSDRRGARTEPGQDRTETRGGRQAGGRRSERQRSERERPEAERSGAQDGGPGVEPLPVGLTAVFFWKDDDMVA